tara:strand:+ start:257 stop:529 length:273 start_codon:yes stop_codon:yes gene_type:complete
MNRLTVDTDFLASFKLVSELRGSIVDQDSTLPYPALDFPTRRQAGVRKHFLNSIGHGELDMAVAGTRINQVRDGLRSTLSVPAWSSPKAR